MIQNIYVSPVPVFQLLTAYVRRKAMANNDFADIPLWKECARWLTRWNALPKDFSSSQFDSKQFCLMIQDGFVICNLICKIDPLAIDRDEIFSRTTETSRVILSFPRSNSHNFFSSNVTVRQHAQHQPLSKRMQKEL